MNIPEELLPVVEWWERDGKKTLAVAALAGVAALAVWGWKARAARERDAASAALAGFADADTLEEACGRFASQPCAPMLRLKLAAALCTRGEDGDFEKALEIYEGLAASGGVPAAYAEVPAAGRAACLESLERWDEAAKAYADFLALPPKDTTLALSAKLGRARCLSQCGGKDEAIAALEALKKEMVGDEAALSRIATALDAAKRWAPAPVEQPPAPEEKVEEPKPVEKPVAAPKPAEKPAAEPKPATEKPAA